MFLIKKKPLKVSFDLDDTIMDWTNHYISRFGEPKTDLEITKNVLTILKKEKEFWMSQPVIRVPEIVHSYCTARVIPKNWIKEQLSLNNLPKAPVYQVPGIGISKYSKVKMSGAEVHIDDSLSVFKNLNSKGIPCLLIDSPFNKEWGPIGRIYSLNMEEIEDTYHLFLETLFPYFKELI